VDTEKIAKRLLALIEKSGADEGEAFVQSSMGLEMEVRDQAVERLKRREAGGFALRLVADHKLAVVTSSDVRDASLQRAVARGVELAATATPDDSNSLPAPLGEEPAVVACDAGFDSIAFDRKVALLKDLETLAFACDPAIRKMQGISYSDSKDDVVVANTNGVFRRRLTTSFNMGCSVIAERAGDVETGGEEAGARFFERLDPPSKLATRACRKAVDLLGGRSVPSQNVPVIFDRNVGDALLSHLVAMVSGENVVTGVSALAGRLGDRLGSSLVTLRLRVGWRAPRLTTRERPALRPWCLKAARSNRFSLTRTPRRNSARAPRAMPGAMASGRCRRSARRTCTSPGGRPVVTT
jgi:PmbA protein